jgi:folate-binding Fe-S cluster repair protein YgfZ
VRLRGEGVSPGAELRAGTLVLGEVTSAAAGEALALIRTDRFAKSIADSLPVTVTVNDAPAEIEGAPWLIAEVKAHLEAKADE